MSLPDVRVGIVSWNTAPLLERCLAALPAALDGLAAEVVVVDNASDDGSEEVARSHAGVRVVQTGENLGYARAMNRALAGSVARAAIALNPDTEPGPGSLAGLVRVLDAHPRVGLVAPRLLNPDGTLQHSVHRFPSVSLAAAAGLLPRRLQRGRVGRRFSLEGLAPHDRAGDVDWAIGAVHCIRTAAVDPQRVYAERWYMYVEDLDLCWRLGQTGWTVWFEPSISVPHVGNAAGAQAWGARRTARWLAATYDWYRLHHGATAMRSYAAVNLVGATARLAGARLGIVPAWLARELRVAVPLHARAALRPASLAAEAPGPPSQEPS